MNQRCSVLPLWSAKARAGIWELWREKCTRAFGPFHLNSPEPVLLGRPERTDERRPETLLAQQYFRRE